MAFEWFSSTRWKVTPKLTGCTDPKFGTTQCTSTGAAAGEIVGNPLSADLRYIQVGESQKAGFVFTPESGETVAEFSCGAWVKMTVRGSTIAEITPINTAATSFTLTFRQSAGKQEPATYLAPTGCTAVPATLTTSGTGFESFGAEQSGLGGSDTVTASRTLKVAAKSCV